MKFINLRNVTNKEINESYSGILRISPYKTNNILYDDPSPLLTSPDEEIKLSDSDGNFLNITFIPKVHPTYVSGHNEMVNIINITQKVTDLYIVKSLTIKPTLHLAGNLDGYPIQIINKDTVLTFPIEAPLDTRYINYDNKLGLNLSADSSDEAIKAAFDKLPASHEIYSDAYSDYHVTINGKKLYRLNGPEGDKKTEIVPELYKHDYILGQYPGHTHKISSLDAAELIDIPTKIKEKIRRVTKLSFIPIEKIIWSFLEGATVGAYRSYEGRYTNLLPIGAGIQGAGTENDLFQKLFVTSNIGDKLGELINEIKGNAPLVGLPIQSGIITYNAIPARRYFFHLLRRYNDAALKKNTYTQIKIIKKDGSEYGQQTYISPAEPSNGLFMHNLTAEYALCDGKRIKEIKNNSFETDYPAINLNSTNFKNWKGGYSNNPKNIYDAMASSMSATTYNAILKTPQLFEIRQMTPCLLRGLNWQRGVSYSKKVTATGVTYENDKWLYNHNSDIINKDGTYIVSDWFDPDNSNISNGADTMMPEIKDGSLNYTFFNNTIKHVLPGTKPDDRCNIPKDIHSIGRHYCNYDYNVSNSYRHTHQPFVKDDLLVNNDQLYNEYRFFQHLDGTMQKPKTSSWTNYVKLQYNTFLKTYIMRSTQGISGINATTLKEIRELPVSVRGGTTSLMREVTSFHKYAKVRRGVCWRNKKKGRYFYQPEGAYHFTGYSARKDGMKEGWRLLSSLPVSRNKYGSWEKSNDYAYALYEDTKVYVDDTLPSAPTINFLPLFKI